MRVTACALALALLALARPATGQETAPARNAVYLEAMGPGLLYSVNYERALSEHVVARIGGSTWDDTNLAYDAAFATLVRPLGRGTGRWELGAGAGLLHLRKFLFLETTSPETNLYGILLTGYAIRPAKSGLFFRVAFTPVFTSEGIGPWGGLSLGLAF